MSSRRVSSGSHRASPYSRPLPGKIQEAEVVSEWKHDMNQDDLFDRSSSNINPQVHLHAILKRTYGNRPSLRPFGMEADDGVGPIGGARTPAAAPPRPTHFPPAIKTTLTYNPLKNLAGPTTIRGASGMPRVQAPQRPAAPPTDKKRLEELKHERSVLEQRFTSERRGFPVEVAGLAFGTSAEDVEAALGNYGEVLYSYIAAATDSGVTARVTLSRWDEANNAVTHLDGALADGMTLNVRHAKPLTDPGPEADFIRRRLAQPSASSPLYMDVVAAASRRTETAKPPESLGDRMDDNAPAKAAPSYNIFNPPPASVSSKRSAPATKSVSDNIFTRQKPLGNPKSSKNIKDSHLDARERNGPAARHNKPGTARNAQSSAGGKKTINGAGAKNSGVNKTKAPPSLLSRLQ